MVIALRCNLITAGYKDNRNGLALATLQGQELVRKNAVSSPTADNSLTMNESYGSMIGFIGEKTSQSRVCSRIFQVIAGPVDHLA